MPHHPCTWYTIFIRNRITREWEKVAEIKSPGLTNNILNQIILPIYGEGEFRTIEGKTNKLPTLMQYYIER